MAAEISNSRHKRRAAPLAGLARGPACGARSGSEQAFKDGGGGGAERGPVSVKRPGPPSAGAPPAPAAERRGRRAWRRWVPAPGGGGWAGRGRAVTPPSPQAAALRGRPRSGVAGPAAVRGLSPSSGREGTAVPSLERAEGGLPAPAGVAVRRFPLAGASSRRSWGSGSVRCGGRGAVWGGGFFCFPPDPRHLPARSAGAFGVVEGRGTPCPARRTPPCQRCGAVRSGVSAPGRASRGAASLSTSERLSGEGG